MAQRVPTVMYHSIGIVNQNWHWNYLTCPFQVFENQLKWLKRMKYYTLNFQELYDYIINDKEIPKNSVFLTFDDGYLDNYVFAYPLLKKYGMKGTIFVNPDFVDKSIKVRRNLDEINLGEAVINLKSDGFCNWNELTKMDKEGILDVQSHAKTHTWYPISEQIIDFRHPFDDYIWMDWNDDPENKSKLQYINWAKVKFGEAIFEHEKALSSRRVFINDDFQFRLNQFVIDNGGVNFFKKRNWKDELIKYSNEVKQNFKIINKKETNEEYLKRLKFELEFTKLEIEKRLKKDVNFLCWPGGSATKDGVEIANNLGYLMSTAARDLSTIERKLIINSPIIKINRISRITPLIFNNWKKEDVKSKIIYSPGWFFILQIMQFKNLYYSNYWMKYLIYSIYKFRLFG